MRINGRKHQRLGAVGAVLAIAQGNGRDVLYLAGRPVELRNLGSTRAVYQIGVQRVGCDVSILDDPHGMPVSKRDRAVIAAAVDANRAALLLSRADAIRKRIVGYRVIKLRRGLVIPGTPCLAAIDSDDRALIADQQNN